MFCLQILTHPFLNQDPRVCCLFYPESPRCCIIALEVLNPTAAARPRNSALGTVPAGWGGSPSRGETWPCAPRGLTRLHSPPGQLLAEAPAGATQAALPPPRRQTLALGNAELPFKNTKKEHSSLQCCSGPLKRQAILALMMLVTKGARHYIN